MDNRRQTGFMLFVILSAQKSGGKMAAAVRRRCLGFASFRYACETPSIDRRRTTSCFAFRCQFLSVVPFFHFSSLSPPPGATYPPAAASASTSASSSSSSPFFPLVHHSPRRSIPTTDCRKRLHYGVHGWMEEIGSKWERGSLSTDPAEERTVGLAEVN